MTLLKKKIIVISVVVVMMTVLLGGLYIIAQTPPVDLNEGGTATPSLGANSTTSTSVTNGATQAGNATGNVSTTKAPEITQGSTQNPTKTPGATITPTPTGGVATNVELVKVSTDKDFGVYEAGQESTITFSADAVANGGVKVFYTLTDLSTRREITGNTTIEAGQRRASVSVKLDSGVYELTFRPEVGKAHERMFVTVLVASDLDGGERFGMDFASTWHLNAGDRLKFIQMLKLAGVTHIRERIMMSEVTNDDGGVNLGGYKNEFKTLKNNGFDIIATWHDIPKGMDNKTKGADLTKIHAHLKEVVNRLKDNISAWEIWNEQDVIHFSTMYPDQYAAYLKACAIAIADGDKDAVKVLGAFARTPQYSKFGKWMMENGVMDYVDVYNFHVYTFTTYGKGLVPGFSDIKEHQDFAALYGGKIPTWQTESGTVHNEEAELRGNDSLTQQAKYYAITAIGSAAMGVERTYPFLLVPYGGEDNLSFFSLGDYAYPAYGAYATVIRMLGDGNMVGKYEADGVTGYRVKRQDNKNMSVFWSLEGEKKLEIKTNSPLTVTDMYGSVTTAQPTDGKITLKVGNSPIYVDAPANMFADFTVNYDNVAVKSISKAQRVVLQPIFATANAPDMPTKATLTTGYEGVNSGYRFNKGETAEITIKVYNFNNQAINGTVNMTLPNGWSAQSKSASVSVDANGSASVTFTVTAASSISKESLDSITFSGSFGLGADTKCVSWVSGR